MQLEHAVGLEGGIEQAAERPGELDLSGVLQDS
jgi:hypothetical protein